MNLPGMQLAPRGAKPEELDAAEKETGVKLPADLRAFLAQHDGGRGTVGSRKRPLVLWSAKEIAEQAEAQEVTRATPGLLLFGTDGGAEGYGYLSQLRSGRYGRISLLAAGAHEFEGLGNSLQELLEAVAQGR